MIFAVLCYKIIITKLIIGFFYTVFFTGEFIQSPLCIYPLALIFCFNYFSYYIARKTLLAIDMWFIDINIPAIIHIQSIISTHPQKTLAILKQTDNRTIGKTIPIGYLFKIMRIGKECN